MTRIAYENRGVVSGPMLSKCSRFATPRMRGAEGQGPYGPQRKWGDINLKAQRGVGSILKLHTSFTLSFGGPYGLRND